DGAEERRPILFIQATNDLAGRLAQALWDYTQDPLNYKPPRVEEDPVGESITVDLRGKLETVLGEPVSFESLRKALGRDAASLGKILTALSARLPYTLVLVI